VRLLSDFARTKKLFLSKNAESALSEVAFTAAGMTNSHPATSLQVLSDKIGDAEKIMADELQGEMWPLTDGKHVY
jgi:hypothetical protein